MHIKLLEIGICKGTEKVSNDFYLDYFKKQGKDMRQYFEEICGRKERYLAEGDTTLTLGIKAAKEALEKNHLTGEAIDMVIFSSNLPELTSPQSSLLVHEAIKGNRKAFCLDVNANCAGMVAAVQLASRELVGNDCRKRALVVGCDFLNWLVDPDNEQCYGQYGDTACAVILEKTEELSEIIDCDTVTEDICLGKVAFPPQGFSHVLNGKAQFKKDFYTKWGDYRGGTAYKIAEGQIKNMLKRNGMTIEQIDALCLSQYALARNQRLEDAIGIAHEKSIYVGDRYGYTGTSSPFLALQEGIETGLVKRGNYILIWTVGIGSLCICMLLRY